MEDTKSTSGPWLALEPDPTMGTGPPTPTSFGRCLGMSHCNITVSPLEEGDAAQAAPLFNELAAYDDDIGTMMTAETLRRDAVEPVRWTRPPPA